MIQHNILGFDTYYFQKWFFLLLGWNLHPPIILSPIPKHPVSYPKASSLLSLIILSLINNNPVSYPQGSCLLSLIILSPIPNHPVSYPQSSCFSSPIILGLSPIILGLSLIMLSLILYLVFFTTAAAVQTINRETDYNTNLHATPFSRAGET